jgi:peptide/nickel transport system permease protein
LKLLRLVAGRLLGGLASIFGASLLSFLFLRALPSNPTRLILGPLAPPASVKALAAQLGLNRSIPVQYWDYITSFFRGDWGYSYIYGRTVSSLIASRLPASVELGLCAFLLALLSASVLALAVTYRPRKIVAVASRGAALVGLSTPLFWMALVALLVGVAWAKILPGPTGQLSANVAPPRSTTGLLLVDSLLAGDYKVFGNVVAHLVLPVTVLAMPSFGFLFRQLRANLLEVAQEPYLLVARARGLSRWSAYVRHALPNVALPTLTMSGLLLAQLLVGSVFVETIFNWPGVGALVVNSVTNQDYSVVETFVLLSACAYVVVNLVVDLLSRLLDPRIRSDPEL